MPRALARVEISRGRVLLFKALANDVRLRLIEALGSGEKSVNELCVEIQEHQTRVSHELRCLTVCGLVDHRRDGKYIIYSLNDQTVVPLLKAADRHVGRFISRMKGCDLLNETKKIKTPILISSKISRGQTARSNP